MLTIFLTSLLLQVETTPAHHIALCIFPEGNVLFSDLPCPPGSENRKRQTRATHMIDFGPVPEFQNTPRSHVKQRNLGRVSKSLSGERCQAAVQGLQDLRLLRRDGDEPTAEQSLDKDEQGLKLSKRQFCRAQPQP